MEHKTTAQQDAIVEESVQQETFKAKARAGTGKTSTAVLVARANEFRKLTYVVFNKSAQLEAEQRMPHNVDSRTGHSLAYKAVVSGKNARFHRKRIQNPFALVREIEDDKIVADALEVTGGDGRSAAFAMVNTLTKFSYSDDEKIQAKHVPSAVTARAGNAKAKRAVASKIARASTALWTVITKKGAHLPITFDYFLKYWSLTKPKLKGDMLMLDEAQDLNPAMLYVVEQQDMPILAWGDSQQQIYQWRGTADALGRLPGKTMPLTMSFRFGPEIASVANEILTMLGEEWMVQGAGLSGDVTDEFTTFTYPNAVLCRGNAGVIRETLELIDRRVRVGVVGGTGEAVALLFACWDLKNNKTPRHAEIGMFNSWVEFEAFCETDEGQGYRPVYKLIERYGEMIPSICMRLKNDTVDESIAEVVVSTAHKAKGREWVHVRMSDDYIPLATEVAPDRWVLNREEANLWYVTVTRAKQRLDMSGNLLRLHEYQQQINGTPVGFSLPAPPVEEEDWSA